MFYEDFSLKFRQKDENLYEVELIEAPYGIPVGGISEFSFPFTTMELTEKLTRSINCQQSEYYKTDLEKLAIQCYDALFHGQLGAHLERALEQTDGHLRLRFVTLSGSSGEPISEIDRFPWEILRSAKVTNYMVLDKNIHIMRQVQVHKLTRQSTRLASVNQSLKALVFISDHAHPAENCQIKEAMPTNQSDRYLDVVYAKGDCLEDLRDALDEHEPDTLLMVCHGSEPKSHQRGIVKIRCHDGSEKNVDGEALSALLSSYKRKLKLVVQMSCHSGEVANGQQNDFLASVSSSLIKGGIPMVIGMQSVISYKAAQLFIKAFFNRLSRQESVEESLRRARVEIHGYNREFTEFFTPVLYTGQRETFLWQMQPEIRIHAVAEPQWDKQEGGKPIALVDLRAFFKGEGLETSRILRPEYDWNKDIMRVLDDLPGKYSLDKERPIRFSGDARLSLWLALGWRLRRVSGYHQLVFKASNNSKDYWQAILPSAPLQRFQHFRESAYDWDSSSRVSDLFVSLSVSRPIETSLKLHLKSFEGKPVIGVDLSLDSPGLSAVTSQEVANEMALEIAAKISSLQQKVGSTTIHLFAAIPMGLAGLLGHYLNTVGQIQLYEHENNLYHKSILLKEGC